LSNIELPDLSLLPLTGINESKVISLREKLPKSYKKRRRKRPRRRRMRRTKEKCKSVFFLLRGRKEGKESEIGWRRGRGRGRGGRRRRGSRRGRRTKKNIQKGIIFLLSPILFLMNW
jgi:hypothetical protein